MKATSEKNYFWNVWSFFSSDVFPVYASEEGVSFDFLHSVNAESIAYELDRQLTFVADQLFDEVDRRIAQIGFLWNDEVFLPI